MRIINSKTVDSFKIKHTVKELEAIKDEFTSGQYKGKKDFLTRRRRFLKAHQDTCILNWQNKRKKNHEDKAVKAGSLAAQNEYFYVPKAIFYRQNTSF